MAVMNEIVIGTLSQVAEETIGENNLYEITDYPFGGISNAQMAAALTPTYNAFYQVGDVFICVDSGTYTKGLAYRFTGTSWVLVEEFATKSYVDNTVGNINTILESLL